MLQRCFFYFSKKPWWANYSLIMVWIWVFIRRMRWWRRRRQNGSWYLWHLRDPYGRAAAAHGTTVSHRVWGGESQLAYSKEKVVTTKCSGNERWCRRESMDELSPWTEKETERQQSGGGRRKAGEGGGDHILTSVNPQNNPLKSVCLSVS